MMRVMALLAILTATAGGWAVVTVDDLPDQAVVGQPMTLAFTVRQHGRTPLDGLKPRVEAEAGGREITAEAAPGSKPGRYTATLTLPTAGAWTLTIKSGFGNSNVSLLPLAAANAGRTTPLLSDVERGRRLFVAKGCLTCHVHPGVPGSGTVAVGPALAGKQLASEFLARFLADPSILGSTGSGSSQMPNLELKPAEIGALVAFLTGSQTQSGE